MKHPVKVEVDDTVHVRITDRFGDPLRVVIGFSAPTERPFVVIQRENSNGYGILVDVDGQHVVNRV